MGDAIGKPEDNIHTADLMPVTEFTAILQDISDLTGLEYWTTLTSLNLTLNNIADLGPLAGLVDLENLQLGWNPITGLGPLTDLVNLTHLSLYSANVPDLAPLSGLTSRSPKAVPDKTRTEGSPSKHSSSPPRS